MWLLIVITRCEYILGLKKSPQNKLCIPMRVPFVYPASHWSGAPLTWLTKDWQLRNSFLFRFFLYLAWPNRSGHDYADCEDDDDDEKQRHNQKKKQEYVSVCTWWWWSWWTTTNAYKKDTDFFKELLAASLTVWWGTKWWYLTKK